MTELGACTGGRGAGLLVGGKEKRPGSGMEAMMESSSAMVDDL
jgi:hypothetical protein